MVAQTENRAVIDCNIGNIAWKLQQVAALSLTKSRIGIIATGKEIVVNNAISIANSTTLTQFCMRHRNFMLLSKWVITIRHFY